MYNKFRSDERGDLMVKKKVAVAMSGGVDSSLTAALLLEKGFNVIGITMRLDSDENILSNDRSCCSANEANDARRVANHLGIDHYVVDFHEEFQSQIVKSFVREYLNGHTPNPCVACNKYIKFGCLFNFIDNLGVDYLATGHYARIDYINDKYLLRKGQDLKKDQSYVLYNVTAEQLSRIMLPLGSQSKDETRRLAEELDLPVAHKPDSQEICFIPDNDYKTFLCKHADKGSEALQPGDIVNIDGKVLGHHNGTAFYTIGQRKGLGIAAPNPLYVLRTDIKNKQVVVGEGKDLFSNTLTADDVHWIYPQKFPFRATAKIRYGPRVAECVVSDLGNGKIRVDFDESQRAITAGQSVVFYDDDIVLGGGIII